MSYEYFFFTKVSNVFDTITLKLSYYITKPIML